MFRPATRLPTVTSSRPTRPDDVRIDAQLELLRTQFDAERAKADTKTSTRRNDGRSKLDKQEHEYRGPGTKR